LAHCGPRGFLLDGNPIERVPIPTRLIPFPVSDAFLVKAKGDSMEPKINDGDLVIVKKCREPKNGGIVVCVNEGDALIKRMQREDEGTILVSLNSKYPPFTAAEDFRVVGEVRGIFSTRIG